MNSRELFETIRKLEDAACTCDVMLGYSCYGHELGEGVRAKVNELLKALGNKSRYE